MRLISIKLLGALVFCASLAATFSAAHAHADMPTKHISVTGQGEVTVIPDQAELTITITETGESVAALQADSDRRVASVMDALLDQGLANEDIDTTQIRIQPRYRYDKGQQQRLSDGFQVDRTISVMLKDLSKLGAVISDLSRMSVDAVSPPMLSSSKREPAYQEALAAAYQQARARAAVLAQAAGLTLGAAQEINAGHSPRPPLPIARMSMAADAESNTFQPGEMAISASVSVVFELAP